MSVAPPVPAGGGPGPTPPAPTPPPPTRSQRFTAWVRKTVPKVVVAIIVGVLAATFMPSKAEIAEVGATAALWWLSPDQAQRLESKVDEVKGSVDVTDGWDGKQWIVGVHNYLDDKVADQQAELEAAQQKERDDALYASMPWHEADNITVDDLLAEREQVYIASGGTAISGVMSYDDVIERCDDDRGWSLELCKEADWAKKMVDTNVGLRALWARRCTGEIASQYANPCMVFNKEYPPTNTKGAHIQGPDGELVPLEIVVPTAPAEAPTAEQQALMDDLKARFAAGDQTVISEEAMVGLTDSQKFQVLVDSTSDATELYGSWEGLQIQRCWKLQDNVAERWKTNCQLWREARIAAGKSPGP